MDNDNIMPAANHLIINSEANPLAKWFVCHTASGHEVRIAATLKQRVEAMGFVKNVFEIMVPTQDRVVIRGGKKATIKEKIFPGYMLVKMIVTDNSWLAVRTTQGVTGFVGTGNNPTPIPQKEVDAILAFALQAAPKFQAAFSLGEAVKIIEGPFTDLLGTVRTIDEAKGKVEVLVSIFGRETPVELDFLQVSKI